jgi:hypothetical protein
MAQELTRKELYNLVWSTPLTQLAKDFGLSDNGLRKICKKYDIPLPKMGHWQKIQYGKKVEQEKLAHFEKWTNIKITIHESEVDEEEHYLTKLAKRVKEIELACSALLPVPESLTNIHPLVKAAKENLNTKKQKKSWRNLPECIHTNWDLLSISVQKHNVPRALRIMNTFIKMAESRGHKVILEDQKTTLVIDGEKFSIRFREKHNRQVIPDQRWSSTEMVPNDILSIKYDNLFDKEWADKGSLLEEQLSRILAFFEIRSVQDKEERERWRIVQIEAERKREIERKQQAQREWEAQKQGLLITKADKWHKAESLRLFITKIEESKDNSPKVKEWLKWAKLQLEELDPISNDIESFITQFDLPEHLKE